MWNELSDRPRIELLRSSVERLESRFDLAIDFIALYGSMARGDFSAGSDFDLFVGMSSDDRERFIDRLLRWGRLVDPPVELLVYSASEVAEMAASRHPLLLIVLDEGIPLVDHGGFALLHAEYRRWVERGEVRKVLGGFDLAVA